MEKSYLDNIVLIHYTFMYLCRYVGSCVHKYLPNKTMMMMSLYINISHKFSSELFISGLPFSKINFNSSSWLKRYPSMEMNVRNWHRMPLSDTTVIIHLPVQCSEMKLKELNLRMYVYRLNTGTCMHVWRSNTPHPPSMQDETLLTS